MMDRILNGTLWALFSLLILVVASRAIGLRFETAMLVFPFLVGLAAALNTKDTKEEG